MLSDSTESLDSPSTPSLPDLSPTTRPPFKGLKDPDSLRNGTSDTVSPPVSSLLRTDESSSRSTPPLLDDLPSRSTEPLTPTRTTLPSDSSSTELSPLTRRPVSTPSPMFPFSSSKSRFPFSSSVADFVSSALGDLDLSSSEVCSTLPTSLSESPKSSTSVDPPT